MPVACPSSTPAPVTPDLVGKTVWIGFQTLSDVIASSLTEPIPWLGSAIASKLITIDNLCATNPDVPDAWANGDIAGTLGDLFESAFPSVDFMAKLARYIEYEAFLKYCACGPTPSAPTFTPNPADTGFNETGCIQTQLHVTNSTTACSFGCSFYVNIRALESSTNNGRLWISDRNNWPTGYNGTWTCPPTDAFWTEIPVTWGTPLSGPTRYPMVNVGQFGPFEGSPLLCLPGSGGDTSAVAVMVTNPGDAEPGGPSQWGILHSDYTIVCHAPPGTSSPPPDITVPTAPPLDCSSAALCAITWNINSNMQNVTQINNSTNETTTNIGIGNSPVAVTQKYVLGTTHTVSGIGSVTVDQVVGVQVVIDGTAAGTGSIVSDPTRYFDTGWIAFGNADGFTEAQRVEHPSQVFLTTLQDVTAIGYNTEMATSLSITELVSPPPSS